MQKKPRRTKRLSPQENLEIALSSGINLEQRVYTISGEINEAVFLGADVAISSMEQLSSEPITIRINSYGGDVYAALAVVGRMRHTKCQIITEAHGAVMSAATAILAAGSVRKMSEFSWGLFHEASYSAEGRHTDVRQQVEQSEREERSWAVFMAKHSAQSVEFWSELVKKGDRYFTAKQMLDLGVIDEII